ncbi:hypothetical protein FA13DRAFT_1736931 [Coprinellus micaceus]|uniref:Uncharacterized protein n=1 Tax=Coprinellus micaceus TaxID=71717 RepID=A0A4Y7SZ49_COPMI|nr:hypothetical protein FA13DRAFT_1736931 [Coprinellus micaceus]
MTSTNAAEKEKREEVKSEVPRPDTRAQVLIPESQRTAATRPSRRRPRQAKRGVGTRVYKCLQ